MTDLLGLVLASHGGVERWREVQAFNVDLSASGIFWGLKGHSDAMRDVHVVAKAHEQWISYHPFKGKDNRSVCTPLLTVIETLEGKTVVARDNPRAAFQGHTSETKWDDLHLAYFTGYAMWNYLNSPFIFTLPGVTAEEIEPWHENGEMRRRLKVKFPDYIATAAPEQTFHVNPDGLIVRMDYSAHVTGGRPTAQYLLNHKNYDGLILPSRRLALRPDASGNGAPEPVIIAIDFASIRLT